MPRKTRTQADNLRRRNEYKMAKTIDDAREFDDFRQDVLPKIRKMLKDGKSTEEIIKFTESYAAARVATIALTDEDSGKALAAAKDLLDRSIGKAKERQEIEHKYSKLKPDEIDSLLLSKLGAATEDESDTDEAH